MEDIQAARMLKLFASLFIMLERPTWLFWSNKIIFGYVSN